MEKPRAKRLGKASQKTPGPKVIVVLGPTATGKSDLAVELAKQFKGEVISADSRQVYRGMDIGSGKITRRETKGIPHHLLDVVNPHGRRYTVDDFKRDGTNAISDILSRGKLPIVCGGTGFYIDALIFNENLPNVPPNQKLRAELAKKTPEALMKMIFRLDPRRARALDPRNKVRVIRAIEISRALGSVPIIDPSPGSKRSSPYDVLWIGLTTDRETLRKRIHARLIKRMRSNKMIREVSSLHQKGVSWKRLHAFGLEYRYLSLYLQDKLTKSEALEQLENQIVDFSKRQTRWFDRNKQIKWLTIGRTPEAKRLTKSFLSA